MKRAPGTDDFHQEQASGLLFDGSPTGSERKTFALSYTSYIAHICSKDTRFHGNDEIYL